MKISWRVRLQEPLWGNVSRRSWKIAHARSLSWENCRCASPQDDKTKQFSERYQSTTVNKCLPSLNWMPPISGSLGNLGPNANGWKPWWRSLLRGSLEISKMIHGESVNNGKFLPWSVNRHFNGLRVCCDLHRWGWNADRERETFPYKNKSRINNFINSRALPIKRKHEKMIPIIPSSTPGIKNEVNKKYFPNRFD